MIQNLSGLKEILVKDWDYSESQVEETVHDLLSMDAPILQAFENWVASKDTKVTQSSPVHHGFNPQRIYDEFQLKPPACFLLLDWIRREPNEALKALETEFGPLKVRRAKGL